MKIKYDPKVNAAYISFKKGAVEVTTMRLTEDIAIDFGPGEEIVGIEILDASEHLELSPKHPEVKLENLIST
ncbi:MAG: DUF2283 domain-containing protein [Candidatus Omnitrophica bacterium]|nr:DUF2283 domain-containing protein [Candidatus Omnitrophota bacterium]MBU4141022.1 DUF2283 domain-containing protein [Candidatus Omnitrophota bacterium]